MLNLRHLFLLMILAAGLSISVITSPFPQPEDYHHFADTRHWMGIPNAMDVFSNLGFAIAGLLGLSAAWNVKRLVKPYETWLKGYSVSLLLVAAGSAYYHLAPDHYGLFWDRAAMTLAFSFYFCFVLASQVSAPLARKLLPLLLLTGLATTLYWYRSELSGQGDLRFYVAFQMLPLILAVLMLVLFPAGTLNRGWLSLTLLCYIGAKWFEMADMGLYQHTGFISGHSVKHGLAALGAWCVIPALIHPHQHRTSIDLPTAPNEAR